MQRLGLPEFSGMSFASTVLMFMCSDRYPVLSLEIARFAQRVLVQPSDYRSGLASLQSLKVYPTTIGLTERIMSVYQPWAY